MRTSTHSLNTPQRISRGLRVMFRTMRPRRDDLILPEVHHSPAGDEYHVFYPRGKALRTVILIYGMTIDGDQDGRLLKFTRSCANAGLKVIIPQLPGLKNFLVAPGDLARLERILASLRPEPGPRAALIGFSTGGSYALLLAANPALQDKIGPVILFSPIYDARDVAERLHAPANPPPQTSKDWDQYIWAQYVIAYRNRAYLGLSEAVVEALEIFLTDYDHNEVAVKKAFYDEHIAPLRLHERHDLVNEGSDLDSLSARGHLADVQSPVFILHDAADRIVPPDHARRMHAELASRGPGYRQEMLITPWLSHVVMRSTGSLTELFRFVTYISEVFRDATQP